MDTGMSSQLADVLVIYGGRWQIGQDPETGMWTAVQRPTPTALSVHVGRTLEELAGKLDRDGADVPPLPRRRPQ
jgi:hypothetical protein